MNLNCEVEPDDLLEVKLDPTGDDTIWLRIVSNTGERDPEMLSVNLSLANAHALREWLHNNLEEISA